MRRMVAWLMGLTGGAAAYRAFRRRPRPAHQDRGAVTVDDPAEALRAKLADVKAEGKTLPVEPDDPDSRRRAVHEQGRAHLDEMQAGETDSD